jgi:hypothetical protein
VSLHRDHAMSGRMVWVRNSVECSAKIAMMALRAGLAATRLLRDRDPTRRIFLKARAVQVC